MPIVSILIHLITLSRLSPCHGAQPKYILDEHINFKTLSQLVVKDSSKEKLSILIDGRRESVFTYKPYTCEKIETKDLAEKYNYRGIFNCEMHSKRQSDGSPFSMTWIGVAAMWMKASHTKKVYQRVDYSHHKWTVEDKEVNSAVSFVFLVQGSYRELESIEVVDLSSKKIKQSFNIIQVSYEMAANNSEAFFLPPGFGCGRFFAGKEPASPEFLLEKLNLHSSDSFRIEMESKLCAASCVDQTAICFPLLG